MKSFLTEGTENGAGGHGGFGKIPRLKGGPILTMRTVSCPRRHRGEVWGARLADRLSGAQPVEEDARPGSATENLPQLVKPEDKRKVDAAVRCGRKQKENEIAVGRPEHDKRADYNSRKSEQDERGQEVWIMRGYHGGWGRQN